MAESAFAWLFVIFAIVESNPLWAIASAIFAVAAQINIWRDKWLKNT